MEKKQLVYDGDRGLRADVYLAQAVPDYSRSAVQKLFRSGKVLVNGQAVRPGCRLEPGDVIEAEFELPADTPVKAVSMPLDIVYEDGDLIIVNKPSGLTVHPAAGHRDDTLVNGLLAYTEEIAGIGDEERPGIVHRLDKDTSGLMCVARSRLAYQSLRQQIDRRKMHRRYLAIVLGDPDFEEAVIDAPIGRSPADRQKQAVIVDTDKYTARNAVTRVTVRERFGSFALAECVLDTGRTHQIRVHMAYIRHPVLGDPLYGGVKKHIPFRATKQQERTYAALCASLKGQLLHAYSLSLLHPATGEEMTFEAPLPEEFRAMLDFLRGELRDRV
ncbi:MAG: RluA family pseudouridine synthase [Abditibacteriota bacterium]|nr:RluA family pseudouridine synthase [Abditibacteriota bacterium]